MIPIDKCGIILYRILVFIKHMLKKVVSTKPKTAKIPRSSAPNDRVRKVDSGNTGFQAKGNSSTGAARARSIGNRNNKPSNKK